MDHPEASFLKAVSVLACLDAAPWNRVILLCWSSGRSGRADRVPSIRAREPTLVRLAVATVSPPAMAPASTGSGSSTRAAPSWLGAWTSVQRCRGEAPFSCIPAYSVRMTGRTTARGESAREEVISPIGSHSPPVGGKTMIRHPHNGIIRTSRRLLELLLAQADGPKRAALPQPAPIPQLLSHQSACGMPLWRAAVARASRSRGR